MSLDWNLKDIKNWKEVCQRETTDEDGEKCYELNGVTESLIWLACGCRFGQITEKNWKEVYARISIWESLRGTMRRRDGEDLFITPDDVIAHIGLWTNACFGKDGMESRREFLKAVRMKLDDTVRWLDNKYDIEEIEEARQ